MIHESVKNHNLAEQKDELSVTALFWEIISFIGFGNGLESGCYACRQFPSIAQ